MNRIASRFVRLSVALLGLVTLAWVLTGNAAKPAVHQRVSLVTDWSHAHVVFSHPANAKLARQVQEDPRYWQQVQRQIPRVLPAQVSLGASRGLPPLEAVKRRRPRTHRDWSEDLGAGGSVGAGNFPAKFSFDSTVADCTNDYVVFNTGLQGSVSQASIVAFNNLYVGCGGTVPSVLWAYETSASPAQILTSPALSLDGSQVAFVQTDGLHAQLVLLKWRANSLLSVTSPGAPPFVATAAYRTCSAPCMTKFDLTDPSGTVHNDDRISSAFIDYSGDQAWVGDSAGYLHKFSGVFRIGIPTEIVDGIWPVRASAVALSSAVLDHATGNVFVGDANGFLFRVDRISGAVIGSGQLDHGVGIVAGPVVDSGNGTVYVSASSDGTTACPGLAACAAVYRLFTNFASGNVGLEATVGTSTVSPAPPNPMYNGFFDSTYLNSADGSGNYYVCGNTGAQPTVYQVPISAGVLGTPVLVSVLTKTTTSPCSPVTDIANPNTNGGPSERIFVSSAGDSWPTNCPGTPPGGCLMNFVVAPWQPNTNYAVGQEVLVRSSGNPNVLFVQVVTAAGTSGASTPAWGFAPDITTGDPNFGPGSVAWLNQGRIDATPFAVWGPGLSPPNVGDRIIDSNGNVELVHFLGTTGGTVPVWPPNPGDQILDGTLTWRNGGPAATIAIPAASGTSGIIIDNTVSSGTLAGTSQIYFSTLTDQACVTSATTGGCAVQASQPTLQ